jgi:hypothetical protein
MHQLPTGGTKKMSKVQIAIKREAELPPGEYRWTLDLYDRSSMLLRFDSGEFDIPDIGTVYITSIDDSSEDTVNQLTVTTDVNARLELLRKITTLGEFEQKIIALQVDRLLEGRAQYGDWKRDSGRSMTKEALEEVLDALQYISAQLLEL